ncbi:hypothetical protein [Pelosinus propionicus]|uniref:Uncharacterized protein n=1 Tax=Pelosinus propionicus DSM 13327 TaxID=1123291 RepID=A0A1I4PLV5_9FIRM|nr:hypothetical protein [Pelosinus propionicus]SFM28821.1 hypothetical protein SAMN04490355_10677 [Pelosinus propionicus DSM 13327]
MLDNRKVMHFTIEDIIKRKIQFTIDNNIFDKIEYKENDEGELLAYNEMLVDIKIMSEDIFVRKYMGIVENIGRQFENEEILDEKKIEKMSGYNNAIVSIVELINPIYKYDLAKI